MTTGENVAKPTSSVKRLRVWISVLVVVVAAVAAGVGVWAFRDRDTADLSGRVVVVGDSRSEEGGGCSVMVGGHPLGVDAVVALYTLVDSDAVGDRVTSTDLRTGRYARGHRGMVCAFPFILSRPDRTAENYRLTVTTRLGSTDVTTHFWDLPADKIFGAPIEVEL